MENNITDPDSHENTDNEQFQQIGNHSSLIEDATNSLQDVMQDVQTHFKTMSQAILNRIDEMGTRIDQLGFMLNDLISEIESSSPSKEQIQTQNISNEMEACTENKQPHIVTDPNL